MADTHQKVFIKLNDAGKRPETVIAVLSKIQGLRDTPEHLVSQTPCYISGKVSLSIAEKAKAYLEQVGAVVQLDEEETSEPSTSLESPQPDSSLETLEYHLTTIDDDVAASFQEVVETPPGVEDITYFDVETPSGADFSESFAEAQTIEEVYEEPPSRRQVPRKIRSKKSSFNFRRIFLFGALLLILALIGGGIWLYTTGRASRIATRYEESPVVGTVGILEIENSEGAELSLHHIIATRITEPIPFDGSIANLRRGDYYVEARKGSQILRYPVYIEGRGHRLKITVSFPTQPTPSHLAYIPAGWFRMGNKETDIAQFGFPDEVPDIDVYIGAFLMNKYEVTNREYAEFIEAGGYENRLYWDMLIEEWDSLVAQVPTYGKVYGSDGWNSIRKYIRTRFVNTDDRPGPRLWDDDIPPYEDLQDDHPVVGISLYEADAYCKWLTQKTGKLHRLPTEAEWEKAARGYEGYYFSYGNEYDATRANTESEGPKKVGSYPPNGFGVYDLTGNVWEWISDHYRDDAYQYLSDTYKNDIRNPKIFNEAQPYDRHIVRGGSFRSVNRINAKATIRYPMFPNDWHTNIGIRYVTMP